MIYYLNRGDYHTLPNESYPLRPVETKYSTPKQKYYCKECGAETKKANVLCVACAHLKQRRVIRPLREELKKLIRLKSFTALGKDFGVSDNTIRKWCKAENLPFRTSDIKQYSDEEWAKI